MVCYNTASDMNTDAEINIKNIEFEICSGRETVAQALPVDILFLIPQIIAENTERDVE